MAPVVMHPCRKCGTELEVIAVDSKKHEILEQCPVCKENLRQRHIVGSTHVEGTPGEDERGSQG